MKTGIPALEIDEAVIGSGIGIAVHPDVTQDVMMTDHLGGREICLRIDEVEEGAEVTEAIVMEVLEVLVDKVETEPRAQLLRPRKRNLRQISRMSFRC